MYTRGMICALAEASLRTGDILTHVDGVALSGSKGPSDLGKLILGPQGSKVEVYVFVYACVCVCVCVCENIIHG